MQIDIDIHSNMRERERQRERILLLSCLQCVPYALRAKRESKTDVV